MAAPSDNTAIIIPAFNEAATIGAVVRSVRGHGTVIVVDDASSDETYENARAAGAHVVRNPRNLGYDGALQRGFETAAMLGAELVVTMDADGQHGAEVMTALLTPLRENEADLVIGHRPRAARFAEWLFNLYSKARFDVPDILCGMKAYRMSLYHAHGCFDRNGSIGTELALTALRRKLPTAGCDIPIRERADTPRFGSSWRANLRILRAIGLAIRADLQDFSDRTGKRDAT